MKKTDYNEIFERITGLLDGKPRLLLHVCCAPCLTASIERLQDKFDITLYYYNPNIYPQAEYEKRLNEIKKLIRLMELDIPVIAEPYDRKEYDVAVGENKGGKEHGKKCSLCIGDRLERTAKKASEGGYDYFCTTLTASPLKNAVEINEYSKIVGERYGVKPLPADFKKKGGNIRIKTLCEKYGVYRQRYCGCAPPKLLVAITGGIASGKSTLTRILNSFGAYTMDADKITRELQAEGNAVCESIKSAFPDCVTDGLLDRNKLKARVFANGEDRKKLESIVHPAVKEEMDRRIAQTDAQIVVCEVPLLFESGMDKGFDLIVAVTSPYEVRKERARLRDGITGEVFDQIVDSQMSDEERNSRASVTVISDENLSQTAKELMREWQKIL
ncbi:MAG: dephospho-CoA kinase [Clostridia bacterium]|nr:dephospho-CoA kinase [Clostridia bacterium]